MPSPSRSKNDRCRWKGDEYRWSASSCEAMLLQLTLLMLSPDASESGVTVDTGAHSQVVELSQAWSCYVIEFDNVETASKGRSLNTSKFSSNSFATQRFFNDLDMGLWGYKTEGVLLMSQHRDRRAFRSSDGEACFAIELLNTLEHYNDEPLILVWQ